MIIDCDACAVRDRECGNCVVSVLLGTPAVGAPGPVDRGAPSTEELDRELHAAIAVLAEFGMVPPLRLVTEPERPVDGDPGTRGGRASGAVPDDRRPARRAPARRRSTATDRRAAG